ncbi:hypothetical protein BLNAU_15834 [Blattamonas nauphoetae]|uniref:Uncharacterized protein n=1 Tax=Blattamonas nauphoetae TaxID=2049346 RepID=A0ABQ9XBE5_9EUKA|nr:hypothetical protein BLNAU_15834 [Blattamonas nauphoetae]
MILPEKYSPFLDSSRTDPGTVDSFTKAFNSLVSMVGDDFKFDDELLQKVSDFLSSITSLTNLTVNIDVLLKTIGQRTTNPAAMFVDSITILLSSSYPSIVEDTLTFIDECLYWCSSSTRLALVSSQIIHRILSSPHLQDLSAIDNRSILNEIIRICFSAIELSSTSYIQTLFIVLQITRSWRTTRMLPLTD